MLSGVRLLPSSHMVERLIIELVFYDKTMKLSLSLSLSSFLYAAQYSSHFGFYYHCKNGANYSTTFEGLRWISQVGERSTGTWKLV